MFTRIQVVLDRAKDFFAFEWLVGDSKPVESEPQQSVITQIGGENNVQHVRAGGEITIVGARNNIQDVQAGGEIVIVATQIGGKNNVQRIE